MRGTLFCGSACEASSPQSLLRDHYLLLHLFSARPISQMGARPSTNHFVAISNYHTRCFKHKFCMTTSGPAHEPAILSKERHTRKPGIGHVRLREPGMRTGLCAHILAGLFNSRGPLAIMYESVVFVRMPEVTRIVLRRHVEHRQQTRICIRSLYVLQQFSLEIVQH